jgi:hypothetical protein
MHNYSDDVSSSDDDGLDHKDSLLATFNSNSNSSFHYNLHDALDDEKLGLALASELDLLTSTNLGE